MSYWTYITGVIKVDVMGRTQHEKRYILETVLDHLPVVSGSEEDMQVYISESRLLNSSSSCDEFGQVTNNLRDRYGQRTRRSGWLHTTDKYILSLDGAFRDRVFNETVREFNKWICRLAKRVEVVSALVKVYDHYGEKLLINAADYDNVYAKMFEWPSWSFGNKDGEPNWCEYLMWDRWRDTEMPLELLYKYYDSETIDNDYVAMLQRREEKEFD